MDRALALNAGALELTPSGGAFPWAITDHDRPFFFTNDTTAATQLIEMHNALVRIGLKRRNDGKDYKIPNR